MRHVRTILLVLVCIAAGLPMACATNDVDFPSSHADYLSGSTPCVVSLVRYPTEPDDMGDLYNGRGFYADGNHLGTDLDLAEGTPVHPIACGTLRVYRPASGYGRLAAVIEHRLAEPLNVTNGLGELVTITSFITIYGHLRLSADRLGKGGGLGHKPGDTVGPEDTIGYVDHDSLNGDGAEHLHFGVRLQTASEAAAADAAWFRGYDSTPSQRRWFADPALFMATLVSSVTPVLWHPPGTVIRRAADARMWMVEAGGIRRPLDAATIAAEGLDDRAIDVTDAELDCTVEGASYVSPRGASVLKFDDASTVYEYSGLGAGHWRKAFISYDAFRSWGWRDEDTSIRPASERESFMAQTADAGFRTLREGSLVQSQGEREVSVVSGGQRLPIFDWPTFLALGYRADEIVVIPDDVIDFIAGTRGNVITPEMIGTCIPPRLGEDPEDPQDPEEENPPDDPPEDPPTGVPAGKLRFLYSGPVMPGTVEFQGMWDPPGPVFYDWVPSTFALCPDPVPGDGSLECLLDAPSGTTYFLFNLHLPDGSWWGDMSFDPKGGKGKTIGTVSLEGPNGSIPYELVSNGTGPLYMNGFIHLIP